MKIAQRAMLGLAVALLALGATVGATGTAGADGPKTDPAVIRAINQQPWVELGPGDTDYRVASVACYLVRYGHHDECDPSGTGEAWPENFAQSVRKYQESKYLPKSGRLDIETWANLQRDNGEIGLGAQGDHVKAVQYAMKVLQDSSLVVDGIYGPATEAAVTAFQKRKEIDADGIFGPITFRAAFAQGAEEKRTPGR
ncbi:MAG TPA: peptidoglycan-binding domain-containing protein [Spirillospora sp.]